MIKGSVIQFLLSQVRTSTEALIGGKVYFYQPGTTITTGIKVYLDEEATAPANNPYTLDADATAQIYASGKYRIVIKDALGVTKFDRDDITFFDFDNPYEIDAIQYSPNTFTQASITAALTAIGTTNKTTLLLRPGTWVISSNADWSAYTNVTFNIVPGAVISHGAFTVNIPNPQAGLYKIFDGTGVISISGNTTTVYPEWWTANTIPGTTDMKAAIQSAVNSLPTTGGEVQFGANIYFIEGINIPGTNASRSIDGIKVKSNITFRGVGYATEIRQSVNCYNTFATHVFTAITNPVTDANQVKNIAFYNIRFTQPTTPGTWAEQKYILNLGSVTGLKVRDCYFIGWSGDAIILGWGLSFDTGTILQIFVRDVSIENNFFDGVDKNNRQAITLAAGENISITNNYFTRSTRPDMPGAIDLEQAAAWAIYSNINIQGNIFEDIGGGGVISILCSGQTVPVSNINILDNIFKNNTTYFAYSIIGGISLSQTVVAANSPERIRIAGNTTYASSSAFFIISGVKDITIENETYIGNGIQTFPNYIGTSHPDSIRPVQNLHFKNNVIKNLVVNIPITEGIIDIYRLTGGEFSGNMFIDSGNNQLGVNGTMNCLKFQNSSPSSNIIISNNSFINNDLFSVSFSPPIAFAPGAPLLYPSTISVRNNNFIYGFDDSPYNDTYSIYNVCPTDTSPNSITLANSATPTVAGGRVFLTGGTTTITNFTKGQVNQQITIVSEHAITITNGTNIFLNGHTNFVMAAKDSLTLIQKADGKWYELSRMVY